MQPQTLNTGNELPKPNKQAQPQDLSKLPDLAPPEQKAPAVQSSAKVTADNSTTVTSESAEEAKAKQDERLTRINAHCAKVAVDAAKRMRQAMGVAPEHQGGPLGTKLEASLMETLRTASKAYSDRTPEK